MSNVLSLNRLKHRDIKEHIHHILEKENISSEPEAVEIIARRAEGGMRDALSILDQALEFDSREMR